jgi:hypothetical protein
MDREGEAEEIGGEGGECAMKHQCDDCVCCLSCVGMCSGDVLCKEVRLCCPCC